MITQETLRFARKTAQALRQRGESKQVRAIEALVEAARDEVLPSLDLLTSTLAGNLLGVIGQTIKNWVLQGRLAGYRIGRRILVPRETVEEHRRQARESLDLEEISIEARQMSAAPPTSIMGKW